MDTRLHIEPKRLTRTIPRLVAAIAVLAIGGAGVASPAGADESDPTICAFGSSEVIDLGTGDEGLEDGGEANDGCDAPALCPLDDPDCDSGTTGEEETPGTTGEGETSGTPSGDDGAGAPGSDGGSEPTAPPSLSVSDVTVREGSAVTVDALFVFTLDRPATETVRVNFRTVGGTATTQVDFLRKGPRPTASLVFQPGQVRKTTRVKVVGDLVAETPETFTVELYEPSGATIAKGVGVGTIVDDDLRLGAAAPGGASVSNAYVQEGDAGQTSWLRFRVHLPAAAAHPTTVDLVVVPGTATLGRDFRVKKTSIEIPAGATMRALWVPVIGDDVRERNEDLTVRVLRTRRNGVATPSISVGVGVIIDDEPRWGAPPST